MNAITEDIRPRPMSKTEIARLYGRNLKDGSALNRLSYWMHLVPGLMDELRRTGYTPRQRLLTSRQVALIFQYLGQP